MSAKQQAFGSPVYPSGINPVTFSGGDEGRWAVTRVIPVAGTALPSVRRVAIHPSHLAPGAATDGSWRLRGTNGHTRYTERAESTELNRRHSPLDRPEATCAALIPIRKTADWWALTQDERRRIFETESRHIAVSIAYLPSIARRLYHARDLGEPFDFLTWFEFAPETEAAFDELLAKLRASPEWRFVDREVDIRLNLAGDRPDGATTTDRAGGK